MQQIQQWQIDQEKLLSLYHFIGEVSQLKSKTIKNFKDYPWTCLVRGIPQDPNGDVKIFSHDATVTAASSPDDEAIDDSLGGSVLLSVHQPDFEPCPKPNENFLEWLRDGWDQFTNEVSHFDTMTQDASNKYCEPAPVFDTYELSFEFSGEVEGGSQVEYFNFNDDERRVQDFERWLPARNAWAARQKVIKRTRDFFAELYQCYKELEREPETLELVIATGFLQTAEDPTINHPVLMQRVRVAFDAKNNILSLEDTDAETEIYVQAFQGLNNIDPNAMTKLQDRLAVSECHPMDTIETPEALKIFVNNLTPNGLFAPTPDEVPANWRSNYKLCVTLDPIFILRKRDDGTARAVERIIKDIEVTGRVPLHLRDLIGGAPIYFDEKSLEKDKHDKNIEESLAEVGGEDPDILLAKEANREQLEIARRIENSNAVLVQGPPGTGKTHTIANLMGHFLSQGKSVLVTSYTRKALAVLKEQLVPEMQPLCVSMLESSNQDMLKSVDGITDYMSHHTAYALGNEIEKLRAVRQKIIDELAATRHTLFQAINQERESIVISGKSISPSRAAAFVLEHSREAESIPGSVDTRMPLPLNPAELSELYRTNVELRPDEESALTSNLPSPSDLLQPNEFAELCASCREFNTVLVELSRKTGWKISIKFNVKDKTSAVSFETNFGNFTAAGLSLEKIKALETHVKENILLDLDNNAWSLRAIIDGKRGGPHREQWEVLIKQIQDAVAYSESVAGDLYEKDIMFSNNIPESYDELVELFTKLREHYREKGTISWFDSFLRRDLSTAQSMAKINGKPISTANDCDVILNKIELEQRVTQCGCSWNRLMSQVPTFANLSENAPEQTAARWIPYIQRALDWHAKGYEPLCKMLADFGIDTGVIFQADPRDSDETTIKRTLDAGRKILPYIIATCINASKLNSVRLDVQGELNLWKGHGNSTVCMAMRKALSSYDPGIYETAFDNFSALYEKNAILVRRRNLLRKLAPVAPEWTVAIQRREGVHGKGTIPDGVNFDDAWTCKQYAAELEKITALSIDELQQKSSDLSKEYRKITARFATVSAWHQLLLRTERDTSMKQDLQGWKLTVKKIGKGTGRSAAKMRKRARELMSKCQRAVPAWIMPISRALEMLDPSKNRFDVVIVDEASQADVTAMAVLYMGEKLIIVGDDQQVSPMAIGIADEQIAHLQTLYIKDKIPNWHLYDAKYSLYDIALTTFQPLMLREHFRCVPAIIEYSNRLAYDGNIKPLRDASSSNLLPAVVNYRVPDGKRDNGKINIHEAYTILALMKACMEQPEYDGKTFGVISLLGTEQSKKIQSLIFQQIDMKENEARKILCGIPPNFQGDERHVIFLSMVDSGNESGGPLALRSSEGFDIKKRYNVAASRARDQLWVVHSLDAENDLKPGDIRKGLLDYSKNPAALTGTAYEQVQKNIEAKSESPFEERVAKALVAKGYNVTQQWPVGAYRLDMVVTCGNNRIAIECDGELYHSTPDQIYNDMERQTILERLGWRFIRIRGSEYFRDPEGTMQRVTNKLNECGIAPERANASASASDNEPRMTDLLRRVIARAAEILKEIN